MADAVPFFRSSILNANDCIVAPQANLIIMRGQ
jgi:hypothetical protein